MKILFFQKPFAAAEKLIGDGGYVMPVLLCTGLILWYCLAMRFFLLKRSIPGSIENYVQTVNPSCRGVFGDVICTWKEAASESCIRPVELAMLATKNRIQRYRRVISSLCAIAPLLGLLGTVSGMIETFASLVAMELFSQSGGVGGGISEALVTTQLGLIIAVPGVVASRLLHRKEERLVNEMQLLYQFIMQTHGERECP